MAVPSLAWRYLPQLRTMCGLSALAFLAFAVFSAPSRPVETASQ
jgi:hypothetical protein